MVIRIQSPTSTSAPDSRNATRQPHDRNASSDSTTLSRASTPAASRLPTGTPTCGQLALSPRLSGAPCSSDISTAPPHSPPRPSPCTNRSSDQQDRGRDADRGVGGQQADEERRDAHDQQSDDEDRACGRTRSPKWPKTMPPSGRATNPTAYGGEGQQRADQRVEVGKNSCVEHQRGGGAVEEEVVPLQRRADEAGDDDLAGRAGQVGGRGGQVVALGHGALLCSGSGSGSVWIVQQSGNPTVVTVG